MPLRSWKRLLSESHGGVELIRAVASPLTLLGYSSSSSFQRGAVAGADHKSSTARSRRLSTDRRVRLQKLACASFALVRSDQEPVFAVDARHAIAGAGEAEVAVAAMLQQPSRSSSGGGGGGGGSSGGSGVRDVHGVCMEALSMLAFGPANARALVDLGVIEVLVSALSAGAHRADSKAAAAAPSPTLVHACSALADLASEGYHRPIAHAGGISAVLGAMRAYGGAESLQQAGCRALRFMAVDAANTRAIVVGTGLTVLTSALETHPLSHGVQVKCRVISVDRDHGFINISPEPCACRGTRASRC
jgi:hypothetical protein